MPSSRPSSAGRRAWGASLCLGGLLCAPGIAGCAPEAPAARGRGVLVIVIDGLRADHVGIQGYDRDTTPGLDALVREGISFDQAFSAAPQLLPAHVSLMTGCEPTVARRFLPSEFEGPSELRWRIPARVPSLAVELLSAGYATAAFVDDPLLTPVHGFGTGFQVYQVLTEESAQGWEGSQPDRILQRFLQWLRGLDPEQPWFAYLHLNELERFWGDPVKDWKSYFEPRPELALIPPVGNTDSVLFALPRTRWRGGAWTLGDYEAAYDAELRALDAQLERLFASLRRQGRYEATSIHVVGSYGLQFGEAGLFLRGGRYSTADLHVPWIYRPRALPAGSGGRVLQELVSTVDLAPTVLAEEGLGIPHGMHGLALEELVRDPAAPPPGRPWVFASCGIQEGCALIGPRYCLEYLFPAGTSDAQLRRSWFGAFVDQGVTPQVSFYDRLETPFPPLEDDHTQAPPELLTLYQKAAFEWMTDMNRARQFLQAPPGGSELDEAEIRRLRLKGYVGNTP